MIMPSNIGELNLISTKLDDVNKSQQESVKISENVEDKTKRISKGKDGKSPGIPSINRLMSMRSAVIK
ncbi:hypothetical protein OnM2_088054 [Erysiphe neolycopersici]|uniref:Uncharacterized protein n=1 Tax=Erysiphe neolycopersici TaxID=212602 RepID=A0A420HDK4_9PEZI|nr:hypothetical protein OnM2_088054 [Erysiphe neolycopersici]